MPPYHSHFAAPLDCHPGRSTPSAPPLRQCLRKILRNHCKPAFWSRFMAHVSV